MRRANPNRTLPLAIGLAVVGVSLFYMLFTAAVYHAVPWAYVAEQSLKRDVNAPGLLGYLLPPAWTVAIVAGGAVALAKDVPAMLLSVSRLMFAWAEDGIFPRRVAALHATYRTPHVAILLSATMATVSILGCHLAGDFFLGVDILVTAMLVNYILMCVSVLTLPSRNPSIARDVRVLPGRTAQRLVAGAGIVILGAFLGMHTLKDLTAPVAAWYFRSTPVWCLVMGVATPSLPARDGGAAATRRGRAGHLRHPASRLTATCPRGTPFPRPRPRDLARRHWPVADRRHGARLRTLDLDATAAAMQPYVEAGCTTFDMADHYGSAELIAGRFRSAQADLPTQLFTKWVPKPDR